LTDVTPRSSLKVESTLAVGVCIGLHKGYTKNVDSILEGL
jgi:hypothetical protein